MEIMMGPLGHLGRPRFSATFSGPPPLTPPWATLGHPWPGIDKMPIHPVFHCTLDKKRGAEAPHAVLWPTLAHPLPIPPGHPGPGGALSLVGVFVAKGAGVVSGGSVMPSWYPGPNQRRLRPPDLGRSRTHPAFFRMLAMSTKWRPLWCFSYRWYKHHVPVSPYDLPYRCLIRQGGCNA